MPAAPGNTNAVKHGGRSARPGVVLARLGKQYSQPYRDALRLRLQAETQLRGTYGKVSILQASRLQTVCRLELSCRIAERTIQNHPELTPEELRAQRSMVTQWSMQRDNLLAKLLDGAGDVDGGDAWAAFDAERALEGRTSVSAADGLELQPGGQNASSDATDNDSKGDDGDGKMENQGDGQ